MLTTDDRVIVCLCGSTRFRTAFEAANERETLSGRIVLSVGFFAHADGARRLTPAEKLALDELHIAKIKLADEVLILNVGGYIGASTKREAWYAVWSGKRLRWWWNDPANLNPTDAEVESWFADGAAWRAAAIRAAA